MIPKTTILLSMFLLLFSCTHLPHAPLHTGSYSAIPEKISNSFSYSRENPPLMKLEREEIALSGYSHSRWSFRSPDDLLNPEKIPHTVVFELFLPHNTRTKHLKTKGKVPLLMVMPISGGGYYVARILARRFAEEGWASTIVHRRKEYRKFKEVSQFDPIVRQMIIDRRRVIDWAEQQSLFDPGRFACAGVSKGGIQTIYLSAVDKRIKASLIMLAGGDLPSLICRSKESGVIRNRNRFLKKNPQSMENLQDDLRKAVRLDPNRLASYIDSRQCLLVLAKYDDCVPYVNGQMLRIALGNPQTLTMNCGHYSALLALPWMLGKSTQFLRSKGF